MECDDGMMLNIAFSTEEAPIHPKKHGSTKRKERSSGADGELKKKQKLVAGDGVKQKASFQGGKNSSRKIGGDDEVGGVGTIGMDDGGQGDKNATRDAVKLPFARKTLGRNNARGQKLRSNPSPVPVKHDQMVKDVDEEADVADAVAMLLAADRKYVAEDWQKTSTKDSKKSGAKKRQQNNAEPQQKPAVVKRGLQGWANAPLLDGCSDFEGLGVNSTLCAGLGEFSFTEPKRIQQALVPGMLTGRDMLVGAGVGSGKTVGYLLPIVQALRAHSPRISRGEGTFAVILCASKESCSAVTDLMGKLMRKFCGWLTCSQFVGGENRTHEKARLRKGVTVMVTTDTRLLDHLENTSAFCTQDLRWFIVDEAGQHLQSRRENRIKRAVRLLEERVKTHEEGIRQQNVLITTCMHPEFPPLCTWMLVKPLCVGLRPKLKGKYWDLDIEEGWGVQQHEPEVMA